TIRREHHLDFRPIGTQLCELRRRHPRHVARNRQGGGVAPLPGGGEALLDGGALRLAYAVDQRVEPEATPFFQDFGIIRNHEAAVVPESAHHLENIAGHGGSEPFSVGLREERRQPMFRPPRRFDGHDDGEFHAAAGWCSTSSAALATSRAASVPAGLVGRTAIRYPMPA